MAVLEHEYPVRFAGLPRWAGPAVVAGFAAGVLGVIWAVWLARDAGDMAAQYAWSSFVRHHPGSAYNLSWFGGIHPASYSVLSPYVMAWLGVRTTGVLACTAASALGGVVLARSGVRRPLPVALWWSVAVWSNLGAGRVTYLLGMAFALMVAVVAQDTAGGGRARPVLGAVFGVVATPGSPVAGLFIEVLAAALWLGGRRRLAYWLAPGPAAVVAVTSILFPFSGVQPFPWYAALFTAGAGVAVALLAPREWRTVRSGAWIYVAGVAFCWALPTPIGSNVERLALLAGAAVVMGASGGRRRIVTYAVTAILAGWTLAQPVATFAATDLARDTGADARPLIAELLSLRAQEGRVEVVPLRTHWEASGIAPYVNLARGWNRQADVGRNPLFYDGTLTSASYRSWLQSWSVGYVVLPAAPPDSGGIAEAGVIATGPSWLSPVWRDADWTIYRVRGADPLASAPATASYAGPAALVVHVPRAGSTTLRVEWSPWLTIDGVDDDAVPRACLARTGRWTELVAPSAGTFTIEARYALDRGTPCPHGGLFSGIS